MASTSAESRPAKTAPFRDIRLFLLLLVIPFVLRLLPFRDTHSWDEATYLQHAEIFAGARANYSELNYRPPLLSVIIAIGYLVWHSTIMAHLIVAALATLGIYCLYRFAAEFYERRIALLAAILYAYAPLPLILGHFILTDAVAFTFMTAAAWRFVRGRNHDGWISGLLAAAAALTRFPALSLLVFFAIHATRVRLPARYLMRTAAGFLAGIAPYLALNQAWWGGWWKPFASGMGKLAILGSPWLYLLGLPLVMSTAVIGLFFYPRLVRTGQATSPDLTLWLWAVVYCLTMACLPLKEIRYLLPAAMALFPIAASGLYHRMRLENDRAWRRIMLIGPLAQLAPILFAGAYAMAIPGHMNATPAQVREVLQDSSEVRTVGLWLKTNVPPETRVYCSAEYPILAYYSGLTVIKISGRQASKPEWIARRMDRPGLFVMSSRFLAEDHLPPAFFDFNPAFSRLWKSGSYIVYAYRGPGAIRFENAADR